MMGEVKFRAWHTKKNRMFSPEEMARDQLTIMTDGKGFVNVHGGSTSLSTFIKSMIPMQFTDVKDERGEEIFVGDLLIFSCEGTLQNGYHEVEDLRSFYEALDTLDSYLRINPIRVAGNIYENKELLS